MSKQGLAALAVSKPFRNYHGPNMNIQEFLDGLVVAIDLPDLQSLSPSIPFVNITDFDSLATLGVMTFAEIEFNTQIHGQWLWDEKITPQQLYDHLTKGE
jgi:hypothetical protein